MDRPLRRHKKFYLNSKSGAKIRVSKQSTKCMSVKLKIYVCKIENLWRKKEKEGVRKHKNCFYIFFRHHSFIANLLLCLYMMASIQLVHHEFAAD